MTLIALVIITLIGGLVMVWYTYRMEGLLTKIIDQNVAALQAAESLDIALAGQKGFVSYYFMDGDPNWLKQLQLYSDIVASRLNDAQALAQTEKEKKALDLIKSKYNEYVTSRDQVVDYYMSGDRRKGTQLHEKVRGYFFNILDLSAQYKYLLRAKVQEVEEKSFLEARNLRIIAGTAVLTALILGILLGFFLVRDILQPIRRLALETNRGGKSKGSRDEVRALRQSVHGLIEEYDHTHFELQKSRSHLLQAEKMALVGKLAAGTAHSIRNPLTSVKMRLFSLSRGLDLSGPQREDFDVISEEIRHIDKIVQNFLEFSRPPRLRMQEISPSDVVDQTVQLLRHRLESYGVDVKMDRLGPLQEILGDPEQLKEVLANLVINSCEAMQGGGTITIEEKEGHEDVLGDVVFIRVKDNGPGIPPSERQRVFDPFFTTKEEGTGLGLSIAVRIVENHGGSLDLVSKEGEGAVFVITLPIRGQDIEHNSNH